VILRHYARRGRIALSMVEPREDGLFAAEDLLAAIRKGADLVVLSQVVFTTGQVLPELPSIIRAARERGARVLLDVYHSLGVFPVDVAALEVDFAVGGSYKYLRGGPGACFLYLHPRHLDGSLSTLDIGWFAKRDPFLYRRPDPAEFAAGGDAFLESTPSVLPWYQARAGQVFTLAVGVDRLRAYSLAQQRRLIGLLAERGVDAEGGREDRGAFVVIREANAVALAEALAQRGVHGDARGSFLRLCPDVLTTHAELSAAAEQIVAARTRGKARRAWASLPGDHAHQRDQHRDQDRRAQHSATMTWAGSIVTMSRSPAAFLRMPRKLEKRRPGRAGSRRTAAQRWAAIALGSEQDRAP
jgi:kynureninase